MRGPVTRSSGRLGALAGLVAASALVCGLLFCGADVTRIVSTVGEDCNSEIGGNFFKGEVGGLGAFRVLSDTSWDLLESFVPYKHYMGSPDAFYAFGDPTNFQFWAWSRPCCLGALGWYWLESNRRQVSFGKLDTLYVRSGLVDFFRGCLSVSTSMASMPFFMLVWWPVFLFSHAEAVTCSSCHDQIPGCAGGAACPLFTRVAANAAVLVGATAAALSLKDLLPIKFLRFLTKGFLEAAKVMANRSAPGTAVDWAGLSMVEVARAPARGLGG